MSHATLGRLRALVLSIAAIAVAMIGLGSAANAASPALPDGSQTGSIIVHKYKQPVSPTNLPHDGSAVDPTLLAGLSPLANVGFTVQQVQGIDLTTNTGWSNASALSSSYNPANAQGSITAAGYTLGAATTQNTDGTGTATFGSLPVGLYLVTESAPPAGATPSAPFLVSVPLTDPSAHDHWLYNVNVYPKNGINAVTKTVSDASAVKLGDPIAWTILGDIPDVATIDGYKITDQLDPKLDFVSAVVTLSDNSVSLVAGTDYTLTTTGNLVSVQFTAAGRAKLAAHSSAQVKVVVNTKVNAIGEIANTAVLYPNAGSFTVTPGQPGGPVETPPVVTKWGNVTVLKTDQSGTALTGAAFKVYTSQADAEAGTNAVDLGTPNQEFVVGANGQVTISGLRYSDWANGAAVASGDPNYRTYYLVETKAPAGYELQADAIPFTVTAASTTVGVDVTVKDVPANAGFQLPFTGGHGLRNYYIAGAFLIALALLLTVRRRQTD
ncbi:MAG: SpaH/EbpB family LPXTG-anchored major pilin [Marmoricola sp.]